MNNYRHYDKSTQTDTIDPLDELMEEYWSIPPIPTRDDIETLSNLIDTKKQLGPSYFTMSFEEARNITKATTSQWVDLMELRESVISWSSVWGGIKAWPETLEILFSRANRRGPEKLRRFVERLLLHEAHGKRFFRELQSLDGMLPTGQAPLRSLWNFQQEQIVTMVEGLTIIQTKLPILRRTAFSTDIRGDMDRQRDELFGLHTPMVSGVNNEETVSREL